MTMSLVGEAHTVREFLDEAFSYVNLDWHEYVEWIVAISGLLKWITCSLTQHVQGKI